MTEIEIEQAKQLREQGKTYREIGDILCYSTTAIHHCLKGARKSAKIYEQIVYKGIYDFFAEHKKLTIYQFTTTVFGYYRQDNYYLIERLFKGQDVRLPVKVIKRMIDITGKSFEELFEVRKGFRE